MVGKTGKLVGLQSKTSKRYAKKGKAMQGRCRNLKARQRRNR